MKEMRSTQRVNFKLPVSLLCESSEGVRQSHTYNIGSGGLYASGNLCLKKGDLVKVSFSQRGNSATLNLDCRVIRVNQSGTALEFVNLSTSAKESLRQLLTPSWDGEDLWEGTLEIAPWYQSNNLSDWMRLNTLLSNWQHRLQIARMVH